MNNNFIPESLLDFVLGIMIAWEFEHWNTPLQVDDILQLIQETHSDEKQYITPNDRMLEKILDKLVKDELVDYTPVNDNNRSNRWYFITFEGGMVHKYGNYVQKRLDEDAEKEKIIKNDLQAKANQKAILYLTLIIAAGTSIAASYYFCQLYDGMSVAHPCAAVYTLAIAVGLGIVILVLVNLQEHKEKAK